MSRCPGSGGIITRQRILALSEGSSEADRAILFTALARLSSSGLAVDAMLGAVSREGRYARRLERTKSLVSSGMPLATAGAKAGLFSSEESSLIALGEGAGQLELVLSHLSDHYVSRAARRRRIKARLVYPGAILVLAVLVSPLPALAAGSIGAPGYLARVASSLLGLALLWRLVAAGAAWLSRSSGSLLRLPLLGSLTELRLRTETLERLALYLRAGVPVVEALGQLRAFHLDAVVAGRLAAAVKALSRGESVAGALRGVNLLDASGFALVAAAEQAGKLDGAVHTQSRSERLRLEDAYDTLATWTPRVVYFAVAGFVASTFL